MGLLLVQGTVCSEPQSGSYTPAGIAGVQMQSDLGGEIGLCLIGHCGLGGRA